MTARELPPNLTARQLQALRLIVQGMTAEEMAGVMGVTRSTATKTTDVLRRKFGVEKKRHLIAEAYRFGLVDGNGKPQRKEG